MPEELEREKEAHAEALRAHDVEELDPTWSEAATASLAADLDQLAPVARFKLVAVDCRRRSCAATLRWESYLAARDSKHLVMGPRTVNCGVRVFLPEPPDRTSPYEARVLFPSCVGRE
jgi:hypothetical protein